VGVVPVFRVTALVDKQLVGIVHGLLLRVGLKMQRYKEAVPNRGTAQKKVFHGAGRSPL